jgi:uncharacterized protein (DUF302 family)
MPTNGLLQLTSPYSVDETVRRIEAAISQRGLQLFALIDHSGEAAKVGLSMPPTKLLIFGSPQSGTPVMQAAPSAALDLPLKVLVAADPTGTVHITYNDPAYLRQRHAIPADLAKNIAGFPALLAKSVE